MAMADARGVYAAAFIGRTAGGQPSYVQGLLAARMHSSPRWPNGHALGLKHIVTFMQCTQLQPGLSMARVQCMLKKGCL
jgi:hypothetical protein